MNFCLLLICSFLVVSNAAKPQRIELTLNRVAVHAWDKSVKGSQNSLCMNPKQMRKSKLFSKEINLPTSCTQFGNGKSPSETIREDPLIRIYQNCIFRNVIYQTEAYFGNKRETGASRGPSYKLAVDLQSPWTWIKSQMCQICSRNGDNCTANRCNQPPKYTISFDCNKYPGCKPTERCGEIDYYYEGLSVVGQFVQTTISFPSGDFADFTPLFKNYNVIAAHALSGQDFLYADGTLGLGQPLSFDDGESAEVDGENFANEDGTNLVRLLLFSTRNAVPKELFSLYIAESTLDVHEPTLLIGQQDLTKVFQPENNTIKYVALSRQKQEDYFLWRLPLNSIHVKSAINQNPQQVAEVVQDFKEDAYISISTTALVLPNNHLKQLLSILQNSYGFKCASNERHLYFVLCSDLTEKIRLGDIQITIYLGNDDLVPLVVNPDKLVQNCRKSGQDDQDEDDDDYGGEDGESQAKSGKYECLLNIQRSYDGATTVLGESVIQNSYLVFDIENRRIGIAPAINSYNENLLALLEKGLEDVITDIVIVAKYDYEFIVRFSAVIILIIIAFITFRKIDKITILIERCIGRQVSIEPVQDEKCNFNDFQNAQWKTDEAPEEASGNVNTQEQKQQQQQQQQDRGVKIIVPKLNQQQTDGDLSQGGNDSHYELASIGRKALELSQQESMDDL